MIDVIDPTSIEAGGLLVTSGYVKGELGDIEGALDDLREGRRVLEAHFGDEHPHVVQAHLNEARVLRLADQPEARRAADE